jgi:hypothetical protein
VSRFTEIIESLRSTCGEGPALATRVERARASATSLADRADAHGWTGVAASMRGAVDALGNVVGELTEFQRAGEAAVAELDLIDDQGSVEQVSVHLSGAQQELTTAAQKVDAVTGLVDAALQACAQAGQRGLPTALNAFREDVIATRGRLEESKNACDAERQAVEAWLQENPDQGTQGSDSGGAAAARPGDGSTAGTSTPENNAPQGNPSGSSETSPAQQPDADVVRPPTAFDKLVDPTGQKRAPQATEPVAGFFTLDEIKRETADEPEPRKVSRFSRRLMAAGSLTLLAAEATIGSAANLGSSAGQFMVGLFLGTIATVVGVPEFKRTVRETKPKHKPRMTARERARGED